MFSQQIINNLWNAFIITCEGMGGIFLFMLLFYFIIQGLDKVYPKPIERAKNSE